MLERKSSKGRLDGLNSGADIGGRDNWGIGQRDSQKNKVEIEEKRGTEIKGGDSKRGNRRSN